MGRKPIDRPAKLIERHLIIAILTATLSPMTLAVVSREPSRIAAAVLGVVHRAAGHTCQGWLPVVQVANIVHALDRQHLDLRKLRLFLTKMA